MKKNGKELVFGVWKFGAPSSKLWPKPRRGRSTILIKETRTTPTREKQHQCKKNNKKVATIGTWGVATWMYGREHQSEMNYSTNTKGTITPMWEEQQH
jgi:hypothetical protein